MDRASPIRMNGSMARIEESNLREAVMTHAEPSEAPKNYPRYSFWECKRYSFLGTSWFN